MSRKLIDAASAAAFLVAFPAAGAVAQIPSTSPAGASARPIARPRGGDFVLPVTFPTLDLEVAEPVDDLTIRRGGAREAGGPLFESSAWSRRWKESPDPASDRHRRWSIRLDSAPAVITLGIGGGKDNEATVLSLRLVTAEGRELLPLSASFPLRLRRSETIELFFSTGAIGGLRDDESRGAPVRLGLYFIPYLVSDPTMVPPGYPAFKVPPELVARFDWSMPEANVPGEVKREFYAEVRRLNPGHRLVPRLFHPYPGCHLDFHFDPEARKKIIDHFTTTIDMLGPELIHAVALGEEENGNLLRGFIESDRPPKWVMKWAARYEADTGRKFAWRSPRSVYGDPGFLDWMKPMVIEYYNGLYDALKAKYPGLVVLQYSSLNDDGNGIAWHEPGELKADGWVLWRFKRREEAFILRASRAGGTPFDLWTSEDGVLRSIERVRESGIPNAEIYHCGFANALPPEGEDAVEQVRKQRRMGVVNEFLFYPLWAMMDPRPGDDGSAWKPGGHAWTEYREALERVLHYHGH